MINHCKRVNTYIFVVLALYYVKGVGAQGRRPLASQLVARTWVKVPGFLPGYRAAGDEIKSSRGRLGDNLFLDCPLIN